MSAFGQHYPWYNLVLLIDGVQERARLNNYGATIQLERRISGPWNRFNFDPVVHLLLPFHRFDKSHLLLLR